MKKIVIVCPLCKGEGIHTIYYLGNKSDLRELAKKMYKRDVNQSEIAKQLGISRQRVWQFLHKD